MPLNNVLNSWKTKPISFYLPLIIVATGGLILLGWLLDIAIIKSVAPDLTAMNPMSAVCFVLAGGALWLLGTRQQPRLAQALAAVVIAVTLLKLADLVFATNFGIDRLLFAGKLDLTAVPNRMAPNTVVCFLLLGIAILLSGRSSEQRVIIAQGFALLTLLVAFLALVGYIYDVQPFYGMLTYIPMALNTAVLFLLASAGILAIQPDAGLMAVWRSKTTGGIVARRLLPAAVLVPSLVGGFILWGQRSGLYGVEFGSALVATTNVLLLLGGIGWTATMLHHADLERTQIEQALRESEARYRGLFENSSDGILITNDTGSYLDANPQAEQLTGYRRDEILRLRVDDLTLQVPHDQIPTVLSGLHNQGNISGEYMVTRKDGRAVPVEFSAVAIAPGLYQSILHDIAARKETEERLRSALRHERQLNDLKLHFVSMVSHDFRTPLAVIRSSTDMLISYSDRMDAAKRRDRLERIQQQVVHLVEMLDDILILDKAETVGANFQPETVDLLAFCKALVAEVQPAASTHKIQFTHNAHSAPVEVDPKLLRRALVNLITNAVKYSPGRDRILVDLNCGENEITLRVQDAGIGIPEADQPHLFEVFHRASNVGDISGTGLGLPIVKQAVEAHGGHISFQSRVNVGTTFTITLPYRRA